MDSSSFIAFLQGDAGEDVQMLVGALQTRSLKLPPPVLSELLSNPNMREEERRVISQIPLLEILPGYWQRVGKTRAGLLELKYKARLVYTLIAQCCIDTNRPLIARDSDYIAFAKHAGLRLIPEARRE